LGAFRGESDWRKSPCIVSPSFVAGADYQAGTAAYKRSDYVVALHEWRPLAEQGYAKAQNNLGVVYDNGYGVPQDDAQAVDWYRKAAEQGDVRAQFNLGLMYGRGQGVARDYVRAYAWFNTAPRWEVRTPLKPES